MTGVKTSDRSPDNPDAARQGEVVFAKPWKRWVFFGSVAVAALIAAIALGVFT